MKNQETPKVKGKNWNEMMERELGEGYITGKGRIKVGNLEFDSVSFVKELGHFNLFSISQICDKQHKVLFTETECLVVTPNFKIPDENQILLKSIKSQPPPNASVPSTSQPTTEPHPDQELETETELHGSSSDFVHTPPTQLETSSPELKSISPEPMEHTYDQP
ncbi:hypothetical protein Tco_1161878 [Tanacetum coccineum]